MVSSNALNEKADSQAFYSSLVVEHIVSKEKNDLFIAWQSRLEQMISIQAGFVRFDKCKPLLCDDDVTKWYTISHFDSPESLQHWVNSKARNRLFKTGQNTFRAYRFKSFTTGLEGWFSQKITGNEKTNLGPPAWKQILSVVCGLFPIVMLRLKLLPNTGLISDWSPGGEMLIMTLITSSLLGLIVMPQVTRILQFWLYPAYQHSQKRIDTLGFVLVSGWLILMASLFDKI